jgi:acetyl esterase
MPLLPEFEAILAQAADPDPSPPHDAYTDPVAAVAYAQELRSRMSTRPGETSLNNVEDRRILDRFDVRIYTPATDGSNPVVVYFHGGGWATGNLDMHDEACRRLSALSSAIIVSVDYRLTPENPFPAPLDDAYDATVWAHANAASLGGDPNRLAVMGGSVGGNLATAVALRSRDESGPAIAFQGLLYPAVDAEMSSDSYKRNGHGYLLSVDLMNWFWRQYLRQESPTNPLASPIHATTLRGLPPALVITAELDPLCDEAEA